MTFERARAAKPSIFFPLIEAFDLLASKGRGTHDYTHYVCGVEYVFESVNNSTKGYMTAQGRGVKRGDYILLKIGQTTVRFQVETVDYYSNPSDMWYATLTQCD